MILIPVITFAGMLGGAGILGPFIIAIFIYLLGIFI